MNSINKKEDVNNDEISLKEILIKAKLYWRYLLSKWIFIVGAGIFGGAAGVVYAMSQEPSYLAEVSFVLEEDQGGGGMAYSGLATQFGLDLGGGGGGVFAGDNLLALMKSRSLVERSLLNPVNIKGKTQTLADYYIDFNKIRDTWQNNPQLKDMHYLPNGDRSNFTLAQDSVLGKFYRRMLGMHLSVDKKDKKTGIITVSVKSKDESFSKAFAEELTKEVSNFYIDTKTKKSVQSLAILQHQTDSVRRALNSNISGVAASVDQNPNPNPARVILMAPSQRRQVDVQANTAMLIEMVKNLEMSKMSLRKETPLIQIIDRPILPLDVDQFGKKRGLILGGILGGFLMIVLLSCIRIYKYLAASI